MSPIYTPGKLVLKKDSVAPGLLDAYGGAAAAYSLRRLSANYTGPVVRVRRSSDSTEQDFTATQVTDGTLTTFCGAGNGFVRTWYDQSTSGKNAEQATTANQPQIVSNGAILTALGKPVLSFDGANDSLTASTLIPTSSTAISHFDVVTSVNYSITKDPGQNEWGYRSLNTTSDSFRYGVVQLPNAYEAIAPTNPTLPFLGCGLFTRSGSIVTRVNGTQVASTATTAIDLRGAAGNVSIGVGAGSNFIAMNAQEVIIYLTNRSADASAIESNVNAHYAIY